jgi:hypothetical protein
MIEQLLDVKGSFRDSASQQAVTSSERQAGLEKGDAEADSPEFGGRLPSLGKENDRCTQRFRRGNGDGMLVNGRQVQHGKLLGMVGMALLANGGVARHGIRSLAMTDGVVVPVKSGNSDGGKDPWSWRSVLKERAMR